MSWLLTSPSPLPPPHVADSIAAARRRHARLEEMAELGLRMMRVCLRQAESSADPAAPPQPPAAGRLSPAEAFDRVGRCVRLTHLQQARVEGDLAALLSNRPHPAERHLSGEIHARAALWYGGAPEPAARVRRLVAEAAERESPDRERLAETLAALDQRLAHDPAYASLDGLSLEEAVRGLCADLQLSPNWRRWTGCGWRPGAPAERRAAFSPFSAPSRRPVAIESG